MSPLRASITWGIAVFCLTISLSPARHPRQLVRDAKGRIFLAEPEHAKAVMQMPQPKNPYEEEARLLRWRATYAEHYRELDKLQASQSTSEKDNSGNDANYNVSPASFRENGATGLLQEDLASKKQTTVDDFVIYWGSVHEKASQQLVVAEQKARSQPKRMVVFGEVASGPSSLTVCIAATLAIFVGWKRWQLNTPFLELAAPLQRPSENLAISQSNRASDLQISLPVAWIEPVSADVDPSGLDRVVKGILWVLAIAMLLRTFTHVMGIQRVFWWPLAELAALWG